MEQEVCRLKELVILVTIMHLNNTVQYNGLLLAPPAHHHL